LISGTEINVRRRFKRAVARESVISLSSIVAFELWHGVAKSQRKNSNTRLLETFLGGPLEWALFDEDDAPQVLFAPSSKPWVGLSTPKTSFSPAKPEDVARHW
jgi:hypothetical protein